MQNADKNCGRKLEHPRETHTDVGKHKCANPSALSWLLDELDYIKWPINVNVFICTGSVG